MEGQFANGSAFGGTPAQEIYRTRVAEMFFCGMRSLEASQLVNTTHIMRCFKMGDALIKRLLVEWGLKRLGTCSGRQWGHEAQ